MKLSFLLPLPISINSLYQNQGRFNKASRRYELTGQKIMSKEGTQLKRLMTKMAKKAVQEQGWSMEELADNHVYMDVNIYFNRKGRDGDNVFKLLQDSMQGVVYQNDSQVLPRVQKIMYDKNDPRVEITFTLVDYVGIFNSKEDAESFISNCESCSRYLNGRCSILKDSLTGSIREEVEVSEVVKCNSYKEKKKK